MSVLWVVDRVGGVGPAVADVVAGLAELEGDALLEGVTTVVGADRDDLGATLGHRVMLPLFRNPFRLRLVEHTVNDAANEIANLAFELFIL